MPTPVEVTDQVYAAWNGDGLGSLAESVDPAIRLIGDPLRPEETSLHGIEGWKHWVRRWETSYEQMRVTPDALVPLDPEHVLALVSFTATPRGGHQQLSWAAAHIWTVRDGRIAGWATHLDVAAAVETLDE